MTLSTLSPPCKRKGLAPRLVGCHILRWATVFAVCLSLAGPVSAEELQGVVVGVADGDTVTVLDADRVEHKVRLAGIDAPERRQAFGTRSRQALASRVFNRSVTVDWHKRDRYGRLVGKVLVENKDAGLDLVAAGLAWHYKAYEREQALPDRLAYAEAERVARESRVGLWADGDPVPPWEFRRRAREQSAAGGSSR